MDNQLKAQTTNDIQLAGFCRLLVALLRDELSENRKLRKQLSRVSEQNVAASDMLAEVLGKRARQNIN